MQHDASDKISFGQIRFVEYLFECLAGVSATTRLVHHPKIESSSDAFSARVLSESSTDRVFGESARKVRRIVSNS